jgi:hypothetical protein
MLRCPSPLRRAGFVAAFLLTAALASHTAGAQTTHPLARTARFQNGNRAPGPITFQPAPDGPILAIEGATLAMTSPQGAITLKPGQLTHARSPERIPDFSAGNVFQVATSVAISFPGAVGGTVTFAPAGRTGANVVTFCPGDVVTPTGNPMCSHPSEGTIPGLMRYTRTGTELGGPARGDLLSGTANIAIRVTSGAPCAYASGANPACRAKFARSTHRGMVAQGGPFGFVFESAQEAPDPGFFYVTLGVLGTILDITPTGLGPGFANPVTSYGGPWTAGRLTVSITDNLGASTQVFVLSGMDTRDPVTGQGSLNLVSGSVSERALSAPTANRGWLNLRIKPPYGVVPALTTRGLAAAIALIALIGTAYVRRRI